MRYEIGRNVILTISLIATIAALAFLKYDFPHGAAQFTVWADFIAHKGAMAGQISERDIGYPLLLVLTGYPWTHSFIGITLLNAAFSIAIPVLAYAIVGSELPAIAFGVAIATILSAAPFIFLKMIHHDQAYLFFTVLALYFGVTFLRQGALCWIYFMTLAALAATLTRPTGNLFIILALGFVFMVDRKRWPHYVVCALLSIGVIGGYSVYRHSIGLDKPEDIYTGRQIFFNPYANARDFGVHIGPETGPATAQLISALKEGIEKNPINSPFYLNWARVHEISPELSQKYFGDSSVDDLLVRVFSHPHYDAFELMCLYIPDDRMFRQAAIEIMMRHPLYIMQYTIRNLLVFFGTEGYMHPRYSGEDAGLVQTLTYSDTVWGQLADVAPGVDELKQDPFSLSLVSDKLNLRARLFFLWRKIALLLFELSLPLAFFGILGAPFTSRGIWIACWFSALIALYNAAIACAFADPSSRYHYSILVEQFICAGIGIHVLLQSATHAARRFLAGYLAAAR